MTRVHSRVLWLLLLGAASCAPSQTAPASAVQTTDGDVVHIIVATTTDVHGRLQPQQVHVKDASGNPVSVEVGGVNLLAGYLAVLRQNYPDRLVLVDCGDIFQGTMLSNEFEGAPLVRIMGQLGYQAAAVGNHEFDFGQVGPISKATVDGDPFGALKALYASASFPALAANIIDKSTGKWVQWSGFQPYRVVQAGPVRVGLVGASTPETPGITIPEVRRFLEFLPIPQTLVAWGQQIQKIESANVLVGLIHAGGYCDNYTNPEDLSGCKEDEELFKVAGELPQGLFSVLMGGHTHRIVAHRMNGLTLLQGGAYLSHLVYAEIAWSKKEKRVVSVTPHVVPLCPWQWESGHTCLEAGSGRQVKATFLGQEVAATDVLAATLTAEERQLMTRAATPTGSVIAAPLKRGEGEDSPEGMLVNQILLERHPEASVAVMNRSGVRTYLHPGEIRVEDVYQLLPFDNSVATVRLSGKQLKELLRVATSGAHDLPILRGVRLRVDLSADPCVGVDANGDGRRERWERNRLESATLEDGSAILDDKEYIVVTNSYLANGGSDFSRVLGGLPAGAVQVEEGFPLLREVVEAWLRARRVQLGTAEDTWTRHPQGPLVHVFDSGQAPDCPQQQPKGQ